MEVRQVRTDAEFILRVGKRKRVEGIKGQKEGWRRMRSGATEEEEKQIISFGFPHFRRRKKSLLGGFFPPLGD